MYSQAVHNGPALPLLALALPLVHLEEEFEEVEARVSHALLLDSAFICKYT